jgi:hypothetical protein
MIIIIIYTSGDGIKEMFDHLTECNYNYIIRIKYIIKDWKKIKYIIIYIFQHKPINNLKSL